MVAYRDHKIGGLFVREAAPSTPKPYAPLLMIHGGAHGWWAFEGWLPYFAERGWIAYSMSLRNHTRSYSVPEQEFLRLSVHDYVIDVANALKWIGQPVSLFGHSMGAIVAQKASESADLRSLALIAPVGPGQLGPMGSQTRPDRPAIPDRELVRRAWLYHPSDDKLNEICSRLVPESPSVVNEYRSGSVLINREKILCPVLVVAGAEDRSGVHNPNAVAQFFGAPCKIVANAGHELMLEPAGVEGAQWLAERLAEIESGRSQGS